MSKHTKGPWTRVRHSWDDSSVYAANGSRVAICRIDEEDVTEETQDACVAVNEANARLIAAAPELLEALEALVNDFGRDGYGGELEDGECRVIDMARNAIAKAIGERP